MFPGFPYSLPVNSFPGRIARRVGQTSPADHPFPALAQPCQFFDIWGVGGLGGFGDKRMHDKRIVPVSEPMQLYLICDGMPTSLHWQLCLNTRVELRRRGAIRPLLSSRGHTYLLCAMQRWSDGAMPRRVRARIPLPVLHSPAPVSWQNLSWQHDDPGRAGREAWVAIL